MIIVEIRIRNSITALIFLRLNCVPSWLTIWPRNVKLVFAKSHLFGISFKFTSLNLINTYQRCSICSSQIRLWTFKSSTKKFRNLSIHAPNIFVIIMWEKMMVAFFMPNGITIQSNKPNLAITSIFYTSSTTILICQNFNCKSKIESH